MAYGHVFALLAGQTSIYENCADDVPSVRDIEKSWLWQLTMRTISCSAEGLMEEYLRDFYHALTCTFSPNDRSSYPFM